MSGIIFLVLSLALLSLPSFIFSTNNMDGDPRNMPHCTFRRLSWNGKKGNLDKGNNFDGGGGET